MKPIYPYDPTLLKELRFGTGRDCQRCGSLFRVSDRDAILQWLRLCKGNQSLIIALRRIVHHQGSGIPLSQLDEDQFHKQAAWLLSSGFIHLCLPGEKGDTTEQTLTGQQKILIERIIDSLHTTSKDFMFEGTSLRIVGTDEWAKLKSSGRYQIVPQEEAKKTLDSMSSWVVLPPSEKAALQEAVSLIPETSSGRLAGGILLLRQTSGAVTRSMEKEPESTPLQPPKIKEQELLHWIEIELVDEQGMGVPDEAYLIVAPDKQEYSGKTDAKGRARVDKIVGGQCTVSFPKLGRNAKKAA